MSDSSYFDDTLDSEFLDEVDALETEQQPDTRVSALDMGQPTPPESFGTQTTRPRRVPEPRHAKF
jgi:hypothetical protein